MSCPSIPSPSPGHCSPTAPLILPWAGHGEPLQPLEAAVSATAMASSRYPWKAAASAERCAGARHFVGLPVLMSEICAASLRQTQRPSPWHGSLRVSDRTLIADRDLSAKNFLVLWRSESYYKAQRWIFVRTRVVVGSRGRNGARGRGHPAPIMRHPARGEHGGRALPERRWRVAKCSSRENEPAECDAGHPECSSGGPEPSAGPGTRGSMRALGARKRSDDLLQTRSIITAFRRRRPSRAGVEHSRGTGIDARPPAPRGRGKQGEAMGIPQRADVLQCHETQGMGPHRARHGRRGEGGRTRRSLHGCAVTAGPASATRGFCAGADPQCRERARVARDHGVGGQAPGSVRGRAQAQALPRPPQLLQSQGAAPEPAGVPPAL